MSVVSVAYAGDQRAVQAQAQPAQPRDAARAPAPPTPPARSEGRDPRQFDSRSFEARAEEQRRALQMQQDQNAQSAEAFRRSGRMTPDERRDLRRQINEAGLDLYQNAPRR